LFTVFTPDDSYPRLSWQKQHATRRILTSKLDLDLRKKPVKCYIWSIGFYVAETWTLESKSERHQVLKYGAGEGWTRSVGPIM
jgi:hypothetical protein